MKSVPPVLVLLLAAAALAGTGSGEARRAELFPGAGTCGLPTTAPIWIEHGEGSVRPDTRAVFARPGVIVASSGTAIPADFRSKGAATVYFQLNMPSIVGETTDPSDPASIVPAADKLFDRAVASTACPTPWIALNELQGPSLPTPWSATNSIYRANVLTLLRRLAERGAHPALLVHGDPNVAGDAATWWRSAAQSAALVYEAYYDAKNIYHLGVGPGNRRMRLGMRNVVDLFGSAGIAAAQMGFMLGLHVAQTPGIAGRQGLQPREAWLRVVKWEALAARQVAVEEGVPTIWSWGWATYGPDSVDPDKPAAACTWLWARDPSLCDGPGVGGAGFNASRIEGQIVLPAGVQCMFADGRLTSGSVSRLARLTRDRHAALSAQFGRFVLERMVSVSEARVLAAERQAIARAFGGDREAYVHALARRHATVAVARGVIADELHLRALAKRGSAPPFEQLTTRTTPRLATATCLHDELPGVGDFPASNDRYLGPSQLPALLPFLFGDRVAPAAPSAPTATAAAAVTLTWPSGHEPDLAGYRVLRAVGEAPLTPLTVGLQPRLSFVDRTAPRRTTVRYALVAVDTSGNASKPSAETSVTAK